MSKLVAVVLVVSLSACGGNVPLPSPPPSPPPTPTPAPTPEPTPTPTPPPPTQAKLLLGYYYATGKHGSYWKEVSGYVNMNRDYVGNRTSEETVEQHLTRLTRDAVKVCSEGKSIMFGLCFGCMENAWWEDAANRMRDQWPCVTHLELADEPGWTIKQAREKIRRTKEGLTRLQLTYKPIGLVVQGERAGEYDAAMTGEDRLDWLGVETYVTAPGGTREENRTVVKTLLRGVSSAWGPRSVFVIGQAYDRNGNWGNEQTLAELQSDTFKAGKDVLGDRLAGFLMFSYGRKGGTRDYPALKDRHIRFSAQEGLFSQPMVVVGDQHARP